MTPSNQQRADRCQQAITAYSDDDDFTNLVDFLADAMHWCDSTGQDFHIALAQACRALHPRTQRRTTRRKENDSMSHTPTPPIRSMPAA